MMRILRSLIELLGPPLDPDAIDDVDLDLAAVIAPLVGLLGRYLRAEVRGIERLPDGPAVVVCNHNAGITAPEPLLLGRAYYEHSGRRGSLRFLGHDAMTAIPLVGNMLIRLGMIRASHANADRALAAGEKIAVLPGGNYEAFRPFSQRHLVDFHGRVGYVRLALRNRVPIVPVLCLGGHETFFVISRGERMARLTGVKRLLRSDSFPLFLGLPWGIGVGPIFHLPLPAKVLVEVGEPINLDGYGPEHLEDRQALEAIGQRVEGELQAMMDRRAAERRWPLLG